MPIPITDVKERMIKYLEETDNVEPGKTYLLDLRVDIRDWNNHQDDYQSELRKRFAAKGHKFVIEKVVALRYNGAKLEETNWGDPSIEAVRISFQMHSVLVIAGAVIMWIISAGICLAVLGIGLWIFGKGAKEAGEGAFDFSLYILPVLAIGLVGYFVFIKRKG